MLQGLSRCIISLRPQQKIFSNPGLLQEYSVLQYQISQLFLTLTLLLSAQDYLDIRFHVSWLNSTKFEVVSFFFAEWLHHRLLWNFPLSGSDFFILPYTLSLGYTSPAFSMPEWRIFTFPCFLQATIFS